jgi:solute carrier family 24 (sodium/potassium/calcium exchanger), member 4
MLIVICNDVISWVEALFMLLCYVGYCVCLKFNTEIERLATPFILQLPIKLPSREEQSSLVTFKNAPDSSYTKGIPNEMSPTSPQQELSQPDTSIYEPNSSWDPNSAWGNETSTTTKPMNGASSWNSNAGGYNDDWGDGTGQSYGAVDESENKPVGVSTTTAVQNPNDYYKPKEARPEQPDPLIKPVNASLMTTIQWHIVFPIHFMCRKTMVDVRQEEYKNHYVMTFIISMIWISIYSYIMVWMITIIGFTLRIPDTVMGLTFVAAGVSVPDALSSIAVIRDGYGDMAVSNAVGSNVFDILVCLGLPW